MTRRMKRIFRPGLVVYDLGGDLGRFEAAMQDIRVMLRLAFVGRKDKDAFGLHLMPAQRVHDHWGEGNGALTGLRLRLSHIQITVGAFAHIQLSALQIDIFPLEAAQFAGAQSGKDRRQQHRSPAV